MSHCSAGRRSRGRRCGCRRRLHQRSCDVTRSRRRRSQLRLPTSVQHESIRTCRAAAINPARCQIAGPIPNPHHTPPNPLPPPLQGPPDPPTSHSSSSSSSTPCDCLADLIIASCRVSVLQKCEWRSDTARTKGRSAAPAGQADRLAAETHNERPQTHIGTLQTWPGSVGRAAAR